MSKRRELTEVMTEIVTTYMRQQLNWFHENMSSMSTEVGELRRRVEGLERAAAEQGKRLDGLNGRELSATGWRTLFERLGALEKNRVDGLVEERRKMVEEVQAKYGLPPTIVKPEPKVPEHEPNKYIRFIVQTDAELRAIAVRTNPMFPPPICPNCQCPYITLRDTTGVRVTCGHPRGCIVRTALEV